VQEFSEVMAQLDVSWSSLRTDALLRSMKSSSEGIICFKDLAAWLRAPADSSQRRTAEEPYVVISADLDASMQAGASPPTSIERRETQGVLSPQEAEEVIQVLRSCDVGGDGVLSVHEFSEIMAQLDGNWSTLRTDALLRHVGPGSRGMITFEDLAAWLCGSHSSAQGLEAKKQSAETSAIVKGPMNVETPKQTCEDEPVRDSGAGDGNATNLQLLPKALPVRSVDELPATRVQRREAQGPLLPEEADEIIEVFRLCNITDESLLSVQEFSEVMAQLDVSWSSLRTDALLRSMKSSSEGAITFAELEHWLRGSCDGPQRRRAEQTSIEAAAGVNSRSQDALQSGKLPEALSRLLTEQESEEILHCLQSSGVNGNDQISREELAGVLRLLGVDWNELRMNAMLRSLSPDSELVGFKEFLDWLSC